jgi:hypothetical protein
MQNTPIHYSEYHNYPSHLQHCYYTYLKFLNFITQSVDLYAIKYAAPPQITTILNTAIKNAIKGIKEFIMPTS